MNNTDYSLDSCKYETCIYNEQVAETCPRMNPESDYPCVCDYRWIAEADGEVDIID